MKRREGHWREHWWREEMKRALRKKCPYSELFWSVFSNIRTEYGEIRSIFLYSVQMRKNTNQNNSEYGHFSCSEGYDLLRNNTGNFPLLNLVFHRLFHIILTLALGQYSFTPLLIFNITLVYWYLLYQPILKNRFKQIFCSSHKK